MDNSILNIILKLLENKDILNVLTQFISKQNFSNLTPNNSSQKIDMNNNLSNMPLYPEPLYYPQSSNKKMNEENNLNNNSNTQTNNASNNFSDIISNLSSSNLSDLISKVSPLMSMLNTFKSKEKENKKSTIFYGADDIDLENIIRPD